MTENEGNSSDNIEEEIEIRTQLRERREGTKRLNIIMTFAVALGLSLLSWQSYTLFNVSIIQGVSGNKIANINNKLDGFSEDLKVASKDRYTGENARDDRIYYDNRLNTLEGKIILASSMCSSGLCDKYEHYLRKTPDISN